MVRVHCQNGDGGGSWVGETLTPFQAPGVQMKGKDPGNGRPRATSSYLEALAMCDKKKRSRSETAFLGATLRNAFAT